jgi:glycosyltransferase involved in cell wall biosynthesis
MSGRHKPAALREQHIPTMRRSANPNPCARPEVAGGAARLIDPYNEDDIAQALLEIIGSSERRKEMRELGLVRARAFNWPETARGTLAALNEMS